eukprot:2451423-Amphidinium_carterae.1
MVVLQQLAEALEACAASGRHPHSGALGDSSGTPQSSEPRCQNQADRAHPQVGMSYPAGAPTADYKAGGNAASLILFAKARLLRALLYWFGCHWVTPPPPVVSA